MGGRRIPIIGFDCLLANKRAAGRPKDLADVHTLERILAKRRTKRLPSES